MFGQEPLLPGDLAAEADLEVHSDTAKLLGHVKNVTNRPPAQTTIRGPVPTYFPTVAEKATHVYLRRGKHTPLSPLNDGPLPIINRIGKSSIEIQVGSYKNGRPRLELHHWKNCKPIVLSTDIVPATKVPLGRKPNNNVN